jgi:hypothetical protein
MLATLDHDMSSSALLEYCLVFNRPAIHWTAPPRVLGYSIGVEPFIVIDSSASSRTLTSQEEELVWASLRASSELLYTF